MSHENKLYILNNEHYWHKCSYEKYFRDNKDIFRNKYISLGSYFKCAVKTCRFKFPSILGPANPCTIKFYNTQGTTYELGPPYTVFWEHLSEHKKGYIEVDVSEFQNL